MAALDTPLLLINNLMIFLKIVNILIELDPFVINHGSKMILKLHEYLKSHGVLSEFWQIGGLFNGAQLPLNGSVIDGAFLSS